MDALIIGGTRNLGPPLAAALREAGYRVTLLNRGITPGPAAPGVERLHADRTDAGALAGALAGREWEVVVDTTLYEGADAAEVARILDGRVGRFVFLSSGQVYLVRQGPVRPFREADYDGPLIPEPDPADDFDHGNWRYGVGKRDAEDELMRAHRERGFPVVTLRLPMIHSERDHYARLRDYLARLRDGGPILVPDSASLPIRHICGDDAIAAMLAAARAEGVDGRAYNVGQDDTLTLDGFLALLGGLIGVEPRTVRVPMATLLGAGLIPHCSPFSEPWMSALDNALGKRDLGLGYTPWAEYLPRLVAYHDASGEPAPPGYGQRTAELALARESGKDVR